MVKKSGKIIFILFAAFFLWACGIEDVPFLDPVPDGNVRTQMNHRAWVDLPPYNDVTFSHFEIYYKIYLSSVLTNATSPAEFPSIHPQLQADFNAVLPHMDATTFTPINMHNFFRGRGFYLLELQDHHIREVLSSSALGASLEFFFPLPRGNPTMTVRSSGTTVTYTLWRSDTHLFDLQPDGFFRNSLDLQENLDEHTNADVDRRNAHLISGAPVYAYVAMFIVAAGMNHITHTPVYSSPTLIHVFLMPDW